MGTVLHASKRHHTPEACCGRYIYVPPSENCSLVLLGGICWRITISLIAFAVLEKKNEGVNCENSLLTALCMHKQQSFNTLAWHQHHC